MVSKSSVQVSWKKAKRADGYEVYRIDEDGDLKRVAKARGAGATSAVVKGLEWDTPYTFTVRAWRKAGHAKKFSRYDHKGKKIRVFYTSRVKKGLRLYYDSKGRLITDVRRIVGKQKRYLLRVNTKRCVTTAYAYGRNKGKRCLVPLKTWLCSPGYGGGTHSGTWRTMEKYRYHALFGNSYSQWAMRIHGHILFHTIPYSRYGSKTSMKVRGYNQLGTAMSMGCVRMPCEGVKWICDNCPRGTKTVIYRSNNAGPFGKPKLKKIPSWHTWDPTDPTCRSLCIKHGCH